MGTYCIILVCMYVCLINNIECPLTNRQLNRKIDVVWSDLDDLRETCQCTDRNKTVTDLVTRQPDQSMANKMEKKIDSSLQKSEQRIMQGFQDEKESRKIFENKMTNLIQDQTLLPVHGGWTVWTQWGECSKSCGTGLVKRSRKCSNPYPGPHGNPCFGDYTDTKLCVLQECTQVHGGWSGWTRWGRCSQTCGTGLMKKRRYCSNPYPGPHGTPCIGDNMDVNICMLRDCPSVDHDSWAYWAPWEQCSHTCGTGLRRRKRQCTNTQSRSSGNSCSGDHTDVEICMLRDCPSVDGAWSDWTSWSTCSATCNGGLISRGRSCNNPKPSSHGAYCDGPNRDSKLCNTNKCPDPIVYFSRHTAKESMVNDVVVFEKYSFRRGTEYSTTTGMFTCIIPGLYHFSVKYTSHLESGSDTNTHCYIMKTYKPYTRKLAYADNSAFGKSGSDYNWRSASGSAYVSLDKGDTVHVGGCKGWDNIGKRGFYFIGALITTA